jgi:hypothetical protein
MCFGDSNYYGDPVTDEVVLPESVEFDQIGTIYGDGVLTGDELSVYIANTEGSERDVLILLASIAKRGVDDRARDALVASVEQQLAMDALFAIFGDLSDDDVVIV